MKLAGSFTTAPLKGLLTSSMNSPVSRSVKNDTVEE
jgi:hypothetical protein